MKNPQLGIIGAGAFGTLLARHLAPHFDLVIHDARKAQAKKAAKHSGGKPGSLKQAASAPVLILAVPVQKMEEVLRAIAGTVKKGALVIDVGSVKVRPARLMQKILPKHADIVGTHPLFGPQSGKHGIRGLNIAVSDVRGKRAACVRRFCKGELKLKVFAVTPEEHDRELAYVHGLTHMLAKVIVALNLPKFRLTTRTYELIDQAVEFVRYDSDELFRAIERENPFSGEAKRAFFTAARNLEEKLRRG